MTGTGGAFRSGGQWYQFSFTCTGSADRMKVIAFKYNIGKTIPESKWAPTACGVHRHTCLFSALSRDPVPSMRVEASVQALSRS